MRWRQCILAPTPSGLYSGRQSARYVTPAKAQEIIAALPPFITAVGVYVDPDPDWVEETFSVAGLNLLQFHGDESPEFCRQFSLPYIKAVRVRAGRRFATIRHPLYRGQRIVAGYLC